MDPDSGPIGIAVSPCTASDHAKCRSDSDARRHVKLLLSVVVTRLGVRRNAEQMPKHQIRQLNTGSNILLEQDNVGGSKTIGSC